MAPSLEFWPGSGFKLNSTKSWFRARLTGHSGTTAQGPINTPRLVPLYKDPDGHTVRPIAIPSVWRKVVDRATVNHFREVLRRHVGPSQYAAMLPEGGAKMAAATRWHAQSSNDTVFVRHSECLQ